jgi:hypothetical protein
MESPEPQSFPSRPELEEYTKAFALAHGYVAVVSRSKVDRSVHLVCDRSGAYRDRVQAPEGSSRRNTATRKTDCPFRLLGIKQKDDTWQLKVQNPLHNHEADDDLIGHSGARNLDQPTLTDITTLSEMGAKPRTIHSLIRSRPDTDNIVIKDIYNARLTARYKKLDGDSSMDYLKRLLVEGGWIHRFKQDDEGRITFLLFCHPKLLDFARQFNRVFLMDCTYKTNRYGMPLFHVVGVSSSGSSFSVAFCFMDNEQTESYKWVLDTLFSVVDGARGLSVICTDRDLALSAALEAICPENTHLLCIWHINSNVKGKAKKIFRTKELVEKFYNSWIQVVYSREEVEFHNNLQLLTDEYGADSEAVQYLQDMDSLEGEVHTGMDQDPCSPWQFSNIKS